MKCCAPLMMMVSFSKVKSPSEMLGRRTRIVDFGLAGGRNVDGGFDDGSVSLPSGLESWGVPDLGGSVVAQLEGGGSLVDVFRSSEGGSEMEWCGVTCVFEAASAGGIDEEGRDVFRSGVLTRRSRGPSTESVYRVFPSCMFHVMR